MFNKLLLSSLLLVSSSSFAMNLFQCEFSKAKSEIAEDVKTGWFVSDTVGNTLNLETIGNYQAVVTTIGSEKNPLVRYSICNGSECLLTTPAYIDSENFGLSTFERDEDGYRYSLLCNIVL